MPVSLQCSNISLSEKDANTLWHHTIEHEQYADELVTVRCVALGEMTSLNTQYRQKNKPTNVLTFSYGEGEHDIALCLEVARHEAVSRGMDSRDYIALLLVHAFLHATGLDHEVSPEIAAKMQEAEKTILGQAGFTVNNL